MTSNDSEAAPKVRFPPPLVFLGFTVLGFLLHKAGLALPFPRAGWPRLVAASVIAAVGLTLLAAALAPFKESGQDPRPWTPAPSLILRGPYRFTRNPMYVGMTLLQIALGLFLANLWIVLLSAPALFVVHRLAVLPEEAYLAVKFGEPYQRYCATVRRYL